MPGFLDVMRQRMGGGRIPLQSGFQGGAPGMMQPSPTPMYQGPNMGMDFGIPMDSGIVRPGQFGGFDEMQDPVMGQAPPPAIQKPMVGPNSAVRRSQKGRMPPPSPPKLGRGGDPVF